MKAIILIQYFGDTEQAPKEAACVAEKITELIAIKNIKKPSIHILGSMIPRYKNTGRAIAEQLTPTFPKIQEEYHEKWLGFSLDKRRLDEGFKDIREIFETSLAGARWMTFPDIIIIVTKNSLLEDIKGKLLERFKTRGEQVDIIMLNRDDSKANPRLGPIYSTFFYKK